MKRNLLFADYCSLLCSLDGFWTANGLYPTSAMRVFRA
jgi:hypothetical protein